MLIPRRWDRDEENEFRPERDARLFDLDADGRQDVLIHRPSATESHRLTQLIARWWALRNSQSLHYCPAPLQTLAPPRTHTKQ